MRALHDGKWNQLAGAILLWRKPILSKEFIERKMAQMDRLASLLTTLGMGSVSRLHLFDRLMPCLLFPIRAGD